MMNPAEQYAALRAIQDGARQAEAVAREEALAAYLEHGADRWRTRYGTVIVKGVGAKPLVSIGDEAAFLDWVAENYPSEVETVVQEPVTRVRPAFRDVIAKRLVAEDEDTVVDPVRGEIVGWARTTPPAPPSVSMAGGKDEASAAAKAAAGRLFLDRLAAGHPVLDSPPQEDLSP